MFEQTKHYRMKSSMLILLGIALMMAAPASADTEVSGHISVDTTWDIAGSPYIVTDDITIYNTTGSTPTLTIDPGVEVRFKNHTGLRVGWYASHPGALNAEGNSLNRILFTANDSKTNGVWDGIYFYDRSNDSLCLLNNCIIEYGGYSYSANVYLASASPTITNCTIQNSSMYGIYCTDDSSPTMSNNEISDNDGYPVRIYANYVPAIGYGNTFSGNTNNAIRVEGDIVSENATWIDQGIPYTVAGNVNIYNTAGSTPTLTIDPGVEVGFKNHIGLYVGWGTSYLGALNADGDSSNRILFTASDSKTNGEWNGIYFYDRSNDSLCLLDHCTIEYGGYSYSANVYLASASPTITNCTIQNSSSYGVYCADGSSPTMSNNEISDNDGYPVGIYANYVPAIGSGNTFSGNTNNAIRVESDIVSENATWIDQGIPYVLRGTVSVYKGGSELVMLTLDPGVEMKFRKGSYYLHIGGGSATYPGALVAEGTPSDQIILTSNEVAPAPGDWGGIRFYGYGDDMSSMDNCVVEYGGVSYSSNIYMVSGISSFVISNCTIRNSSMYGIRLDGYSKPTIRDCTIVDNVNDGVHCDNANPSPIITDSEISDNGEYPIRIGANSVKNVTGNTYTGNGINAIEVRAQDISEDATWIDQSIPYVITGSTYIRGSSYSEPTLTLNPGVEMRFNANTGMYIGGSSAATAGFLIADGTPSDQIIFTSNAAMPDWYGLYYYAHSDYTSMLDNCIIEYGGGSYNSNIYLRDDMSSFIVSECTIQNSSRYGIRLDGYSAPTIQDCIISNNGDDGIHCDNTNPYPTITGNSITDNGEYAINIGAAHVHQVTGNTYSGNGKNTVDDRNAIEVLGQTITGDAIWIDQDIPYVIAGDVYVNGGTTSDPAELTLNPAVVMKFNEGTGLYIGIGANPGQRGVLNADGSPGSEIIFTSNEGVPAAGDWDGIRFRTQRLEAGSLLDHCVIEYGGYASPYANVYVYSGSPTITDSVIRHGKETGIDVYDSHTCTISGNTIIHNQDHGIRVRYNSYPDITDNTITRNECGVKIETSGSGSNPVINDNNIFDNPYYGVYNAQTAITVNAENNWWGNATGPYDPSPIGLHNPDGTGDRVSDYVDYDPWKTVTEDYHHIRILPGGPLTMIAGTTQEFTAYACDVQDDIIGTALVNWSVTGSIGTVNPNESTDATTFRAINASAGMVHADDGRGSTDDVAITVETPTIPDVVACDVNGTPRNFFRESDSVYCRGFVLEANTWVDIYIVDDSNWSAGDPIPADVSGGKENVTTDANGTIPITLVWAAEIEVGQYDIIVDVDQDGYIDTDDAIDDNLEVGFEAVPTVYSNDMSGSEKNSYLPCGDVYASATGLLPDTNYTIWIQLEPVLEGDALVDSEDPSGGQELVMTTGDGDLANTLIWSDVPSGPEWDVRYDIIVDRTGDGEGMYNSLHDGSDDIESWGFAAPGKLCGDVDENGIVNIMDARLLMNNVSQAGYPVDSRIGDVDGDSDLDGDDVQLLVAHVFNPAGHQLNCSTPVCS